MSELDVLDEAIAALREESRGRSANDERASATRRSVLLVAPRRRRRAIYVRYALPLAAVLAMSTAWAAVTGRLPRLFHAEAPLPPPTDSSVASTTTPAPRSSVAISTPPVESIAVAPTAPTVPQASATATAIAKIDREEPLYRAAHEAHFVSRDYARALAAWDAYLAQYPNGRFAPEARYNRAIALVRLDRRDEARAALRPFAEAKPGGYRREEAQQLLDALEK